MKKEIRKQIRAANRVIIDYEWAKEGCTVFNHYGWLWQPTYRNVYGRSDRRAVKRAAKEAVKAFAKNADGSFRRCGKVRAAARLNLARVIFDRAEKAMFEMLEG